MCKFELEIQEEDKEKKKKAHEDLVKTLRARFSNIEEIKQESQEGDKGIIKIIWGIIKAKIGVDQTKGFWEMVVNILKRNNVGLKVKDGEYEFEMTNLNLKKTHYLNDFPEWMIRPRKSDV